MAVLFSSSPNAINPSDPPIDIKIEEGKPLTAEEVQAVALLEISQALWSIWEDMPRSSRE